MNMKKTAYAGTTIHGVVNTNDVEITSIEDEALKEYSIDALEYFIEMISERVKDKIYKEISEDMKKLSYKK